MSNWTPIQVENNVSIFDKAKYDHFSDGIQEALEGLDSLEVALQNTNANMNELVDNIDVSLLSYITGGYRDEDVLYLTGKNGEILASIDLPASSGGGEAEGSSVLTLTNTSGWISKDVSTSDEKVEVSFTWSSLENELPTGNGIVTVYVGGRQMLSKSVPQGSNTIDVLPYIQRGANTIRFTITDLYGKSKIFQVSVNLIELSLTSTFDWSNRFTLGSDISVPFMPVGSVDKTVTITVNDNPVYEQVISTSGRVISYSINNSNFIEGLNTVNISMSATINEQELSVPTLTYNIYVASSSMEYIIPNEDKNKLTVNQFDIVNIPYIAYNPSSLMSDITITYNGVTIASASVNRQKQNIAIRFDSYDSNNHALIRFTNGNFHYDITFTVNESTLPVSAKTDGLDFALLATGRTNSEQNKSTWSNNGVSCTITGVQFGILDGWVQDENGDTALKLMNGGKCVVNKDIFLQDAKTTGKAFEVEFKVDDCESRDEVIIDCTNNAGVGLKVTCDTITFKSEQLTMQQRFYPSSKIRFTVVVESTNEDRLLYIYMNGVLCMIEQYAQNDSFSHAISNLLTFKTNKCSLYIYAIRHYNISMQHDEVLDNYIADRGSRTEMLELYQKNNICDQYGEVTPEKLPANVGYIVITGAELPSAKKDYKNVDMNFVYPIDETRNWHCTNGRIDVQGSSSQFYRRKNFTIEPNYNGEWYDNSNRLITGWGFFKENESDYYVPTDSFVLKADVASSEGYNNSELVDIFEDGKRWKTVKQRAGKGYRQTIKSFPIFCFWNDGNTTKFYGKFNLGTGKNSIAVYGYEDADQQISFENNTSELTNFMTDNMSNADTDFSWEYGEDEGYTEIQRFLSFVNSCNPEKATNQTIPAITYNGTRYTKDSVAFRNARFKAMLSTYCPVEQVLYYFLWVEQYLLTDSLSKNCQWFIRSED